MRRLTQVFDGTFLKFLMVGVINTIVGTTVMFSLFNVFHVSYWGASAANYIVGSIVSYLLNKYITFQQREHSWRSIVRFVVNITVCYVVAYGLAKPLVYQLLARMNPVVKDNLALVTGMGLFTVLNYVGQRYWAFKAPTATK